MAQLYRLCSVAIRPLFQARTKREICVSGFNFSIVGDDGGGLGTLFMHAVWGDLTGSPRRFPELVVHRPERVRELHRELARTWRSERERFVAPSGDDYTRWFAEQFEHMLVLYREASEHDLWVTNDPDRLECSVAPGGLRLPVIGASSVDDQTSPGVGIAGLLALGALGLCAWRDRRTEACRAEDPEAIARRGG